jgi:hypothetical protein
MGRHPVFYAPDIVNGQKNWTFRPEDVILRYVDSGMPVILGVENTGSQIGHAVVAIGSERRDNIDITVLPQRSTQADFLTHFLVNDDQRGTCLRLPLRSADLTAEYPYSLEENLLYLIVPLPNKVFLSAEIAEAIAWDFCTQMGSQIQSLVSQSFLPTGLTAWSPCPDFYNQLASGPIIARTYLTYGWRYKARMLKNTVSAQLKQELLRRDFPRYVWVTEFSLPSESTNHNPCLRKVRAHVVNDATGSRFWESTLLGDLPGISIFWDFDPSQSGAPPSRSVHFSADSDGYFPKVRGIDDYSICTV